MINEFAQEWINVLKSGDYNQGHAMLYRPDTDCYCCLGVACKLAELKGVVVKKTVVDVNGKQTYIGTSLKHHEEVKEMLGLTDEGNEKLMELNDSIGLTFLQIVNYVTRYPREFFKD